MAKKQKKRKGLAGKVGNTADNSSLNQASGKRSAKPSAKQSTTQSTTAYIAKRIPEIPAFWIAVIIPVICLVGAWSYPPVATPMELKSYTSQIYLSGLLFFWYWMQRNQTEAVLTFSPARICFGLLFIAGTLSLLWANNPDFWVYKWNKWFAGFVMFLLGLHITQNEKNLDTVINLSILGGLITALIGIAQYVFGFNGVPQTAFPASTFGNANMAGQLMVFIAPLPLYFLFKQNISTSKIWFYAITLALLFTYIFYTKTRTVWLAFGLETILISAYIIFDKKQRQNWLYWSKEKTIASIAALVLLFVLLGSSQNGFQPFWEIAAIELTSLSTTINSTAEEAGGVRYAIWEKTFEMIKDHLIMGTGLGSYFHNVNLEDYQSLRILGVQRIHNDVFELAVELGLIGLIFLLGIIVSVCLLLYKLILRSEGQKRILFALLTIAVTGSMLNAQTSFPYQLPVPIIVMPFFMALIIRGSEDIEKNIKTIIIKPWFNKLTMSLCGVIFIFISVNDLTWSRDINLLNKIVATDNNTPWKPLNPIYNQAYITGSRSVSEALKGTGRDQLSLNVITPALEYWPNSTANATIASQNYLNLKNYERTEYWAKKTIEHQMKDSYLGEYYLMEAYQQTGQIEKYRELYESLKAQPDSSLSQNQNTYNMLHTMSINLDDREMTSYFYDMFSQSFGEFAPVIGNQAVFLVNNGRIPEAIPLMRRTLEINPGFPLAEEFEQYIAQYPDL